LNQFFPKRKYKLIAFVLSFQSDLPTYSNLSQVHNETGFIEKYQQAAHLAKVTICFCQSKKDFFFDKSEP
jgi:hypothetical protein